MTETLTIIVQEEIKEFMKITKHLIRVYLQKSPIRYCRQSTN